MRAWVWANTTKFKNYPRHVLYINVGNFIILSLQFHFYFYFHFFLKKIYIKHGRKRQQAKSQQIALACFSKQPLNIFFLKKIKHKNIIVAAGSHPEISNLWLLDPIFIWIKSSKIIIQNKIFYLVSQDCD